MNMLDPQIAKMTVELNELQSVLERSSFVSDVVRIDLKIVASKVNDC